LRIAVLLFAYDLIPVSAGRLGQTALQELYFPPRGGRVEKKAANSRRHHLDLHADMHSSTFHYTGQIEELREIN